MMEVLNIMMMCTWTENENDVVKMDLKLASKALILFLTHTKDKINVK